MGVVLILKQHITQAMTDLARHDKTIFIGYNLAYGSKCYGTMQDVPADKIIEMPVAEYLSSGMALGLSLNGYRPVLVFERQDFLWMAMDQIVNHIDKIEYMSGGQYTAPVTLRVITGARKPLYPGPQHCQDYTPVLHQLLHMPIFTVNSVKDVRHYYIQRNHPVMFIEYRENYEKETKAPARNGTA